MRKCACFFTLFMWKLMLRIFPEFENEDLLLDDSFLRVNVVELLEIGLKQNLAKLRKHFLNRAKHNVLKMQVMTNEFKSYSFEHNASANAFQNFVCTTRRTAKFNVI